MDVPEDLKRSLKGEDEPAKGEDKGSDGEPAKASGTKDTDNGEYRGDMIDEVLNSQKSNFEEIENSKLMREVLQMYSDIKFSPFESDLRVKDASYTVTNHIQAYEVSDSEKNNPIYDTVASSSFVAKFIRKLKHFAKKHEWRKKSETRVLLDDVNLNFESGKMYLILGVSIAL